MFIIEKPSAISFRNCVLGQGETEKEAWEDAYGPKPWSTYTKKSAKGAWAKQVTEDSPVPPCPEGVPYDNHLVDCNCD